VSVKFLSNNFIETSVLTPSTVNSQFPVANIQHDFRTKVYRSTSNSDNIVIDLGSAQSVDFFAIVPDYRNGFGVSTLTLEANSADSWGAPAFSQSITLDTTHQVGVETFATQSYRYWRLVMSSTLGYCEISNMFLGPASSLTTNGPSYNYNYKSMDLVNESSSRYGQKFIDDIAQRKQITNLKFDVLNKTELDILLDVVDEVRTVKPMFVKIGNDDQVIINDEDRLNGMYYLKGEPSFSNTNTGFWSVTFNLIEAM